MMPLVLQFSVLLILVCISQGFAIVRDPAGVCQQIRSIKFPHPVSKHILELLIPPSLHSCSKPPNWLFLTAFSSSFHVSVPQHLFFCQLSSILFYIHLFSISFQTWFLAVSFKHLQKFNFIDFGFNLSSFSLVNGQHVALYVNTLSSNVKLLHQSLHFCTILQYRRITLYDMMLCRGASSFPLFQKITVPSSSRLEGGLETLFSKCWELPLTQWHGVLSQETWVLTCNVVCCDV
jgi:hypothetical protein